MMKQMQMAALLLALLLLVGCGGKKTPAQDGQTDIEEEIILDDQMVEPCAHEAVVYQEVEEATCTQEGSAVYVCEACGEAIYSLKTPVLEHSYQNASNADGHWQVCALCGQRTAAEAHKLSDSVCTVCGYGCTHHYEDRVVAPTCTAMGYTAHVCAQCGNVVTDSFTKALGHEYASTIIKAPSCEMAGEAEFVCRRCGVKFQKSVPATAHHVVTDAAVDPTCQNIGLTQGLHCDKCGAVLLAQETIPVVGHQYQDGKCVWCGEVAPADNSGEPEDNSQPENSGEEETSNQLPEIPA